MRLDFTNKKLGHLKFIEPSGKKAKDGSYFWKAKCTCGNVIEIQSTLIKIRKTKDCGCLISYKKKYKGKKIGKWTLLKFIHKRYEPKWLCRCICGTVKVISQSNLFAGQSKSCGCIQRYNKEEAGAKIYYNHYKLFAGYRKKQFKISFKTFKKFIKQNCYYCGSRPIKLVYSKHNLTKYLFNGLDRVNNDKGYLLNNIVTCCKICNRAKYTMTQIDFLDWIKRIKKFDHCKLCGSKK